MRGHLSLFLALSTIGCVKVTETVLVYPDATTTDGGQEPADADPTDIGFTADSGLSDATPLDSGPSDGGETDTGVPDDCQRALGVPCAVFEEGYIKASNTDALDNFGISVALSSDGNTLAVGARFEASDLVNGELDNSAPGSGAAYIFVRRGGTWTFQAWLKASNPGEGDRFGFSVALSGDGNTLAVGAYEEASATMQNGGDNTVGGSGAVYLFVRNGEQWTPQRYLKASNIGENDNFGYALALSEDGNTLAVGAPGEASSGMNNPMDNSAIDSGAVYLFTRSGTNWSQPTYLKASNTGEEDKFGISVALSGDGNTLAVGAHRESSNSPQDQMNDDATDSGAVYVFARDTGGWPQQAYLKASNLGAGDYFGASVILNDDGDTLAVGAYAEGGANNLNKVSGAVYIFERRDTTWSEEEYLKASNAGAGDEFGFSIALSGDGDVLVVGAFREDSNATGVNGDQNDSSAGNSGAVYLFRRTDAVWSQQAYLKASNTGGGDEFGYSVALSSDGTTLAVGAYLEDSNATRVNNNQADNSADESGAVYVRRIAP